MTITEQALSPGITSESRLVVGISDMKVTNDPQKLLVTYSLGSCVGMTLYDATVGVAGMIHCLLPLSKIDPVKAAANPFMFVDTGVPRLLQAMYEKGATRKTIIAKVAGAASRLGTNQVFKIGKRNYTVLRKILWKNSILIKSENVGGSMARTMIMQVGTGRTVVKMEGREVEL